MGLAALRADARHKVGATQWVGEGAYAAAARRAQSIDIDEANKARNEFEAMRMLQTGQRHVAVGGRQVWGWPTPPPLAARRCRASSLAFCLALPPVCGYDLCTDRSILRSILCLKLEGGNLSFCRSVEGHSQP